MLFLLVPALMAQAPAVPTHKLEVLLDHLKQIGEATIQERDSLARIKADKATRTWEGSREDLAKILSPTTLDKAAELFGRMKDSRTAEAALEASELLANAGLQEGRPKQRMAAERACVRAFILAKAGRWFEMPDLNAAITPLMPKEGKQPTGTLQNITKVLKMHSEAVASKDAGAAAKAARILYDSLDSLEK